MGYRHLQNTLKAIALTVPAARAFEMTVEFALGEGKDTATVGRLEDHFRDRPPMKACIERMKAYPSGSLGYTYAKVMKHLGYAAHFYGDRPSISEETDYVTMRVRKTHDLHHIVTGFSMTGPGELGVIAITALQYGYPAFMTLDLGAIALSMLRVAGWSDQVRYVRSGWDMAERITPLMGVRWEDGLDRPWTSGGESSTSSQSGRGRIAGTPS
jgi:ubiquinone biosynthesis protein COQ4